MKRIMALVIAAVLLLSAGARAQEAALSPIDEFMYRGRQALMLLSWGETDQALEVLNFSFDVESLYSEDGFRQFIEESFLLLDSGSVQVDVAVCWQDETGLWRLGIPLVEPVSWDVEVLVLESRDQIEFSGYAATTWGALEEAAALAVQTYWNVEYAPGAPVLFADE